MTKSKIEIQILADIRDIKEKIKSLNQQFGDFQKSTSRVVESVSNKFNGLGSSVIKVGLAFQSGMWVFRELGNIWNNKRCR